jgi:hypothetical protein
MKILNTLMILLFILSACAADSKTLIPSFVCLLCATWFGFYNYFEERNKNR